MDKETEKEEQGIKYADADSKESRKDDDDNVEGDNKDEKKNKMKLKKVSKEDVRIDK